MRLRTRQPLLTYLLSGVAARRLSSIYPSSLLSCLGLGLGLGTLFGSPNT